MISEEYVVVRLTNGELLYISKSDWLDYIERYPNHALILVVAEGLTEEQASQFVSLAKES